MKIVAVAANNHRRAFEVSVAGAVYAMPYCRLDPAPCGRDPVVRVFADEELGREGFTYVLRSGAEGSVHMDSVLEYNEDPAYMRDLIVYNLTIAARRAMKASPLSQREVMRRAGTSPAQIQRLLDPKNRTKSIDKLVVLLVAMDCDVELAVSPAGSAHGREPRTRIPASSRARST